MLRWIEKSEKMLLDVYFYSNIDDKYRPAIEEIGLQTLVSTFCSSKATTTAAKEFKTELREMDLPMISCTKIYSALQEWLRQVEMEEESSSDDTTTTSRESRNSNVSSIGMFSPTSHA
jgi:hypothetical protein